MFTISADTISGLVVGFALGVLVYYTYVRLMYEVVDEKQDKQEQSEVKNNELYSEPRFFGRSCQNFASSMNIDSPPKNKCQYLNQVSGHCIRFNKQLFVLGGKYERCMECKDKFQ